MSAILNLTKTIQYFKIKSCLNFEALFPFWKNNLDLVKKVRFESTTRQLYFNKSNQRKIFRNDGELSVHNFHSVSKIFDMFSQMCSCFDPRLSKYQYSFKEGYSVQRCVTYGNWKISKISKQQCDTCSIISELLFAKLHTFDSNFSLKLIHSYLSSRFKGFVEIGNMYNSGAELFCLEHQKDPF